jgi:predicted nucleic acid-binding protein
LIPESSDENMQLLCSLCPELKKKCPGPLAMDRGTFLVVTSTVTLLEVLVHPLRSNNTEMAAEYRDILLNSNLMSLEVSNAIAERAAQLRATHNIRTPDAIQISTALEAGATHFFTNDIQLPDIPSIQILSLDSLR